MYYVRKVKKTIFPETSCTYEGQQQLATWQVSLIFLGTRLVIPSKLKPYWIPYQNGRSVSDPFSDQNGAKPYPMLRHIISAHTYMAYTREYPPPPGSTSAPPIDEPRTPRD